MARLKRVLPADEAQQADATPDATPSQPTTPSKKRRRRRGRTSSERGKAFRKRQGSQEALLEQQVASLQQEIQDKQFLLSVCEAKFHRSRHSVHGPLVALAMEYFRVFKCGLRSSIESLTSRERDCIQRQEVFMYSIMDPEMAVGSHARGPEAALEQWRLHTLASKDLPMEVVGPPIVLGPDENPILQIQLQASLRLTPQFVEVVFDSSARSHALQLLKKSMHKTMNLSWRVYLQFSAEKRIQWKIAQADYVQSFLDLGLGLREVTELLTTSRLTLHSTIETVEEGSDGGEKARPAARA